MKNILLLVHQDAGQNARLQAALDVTRALDGHLYCVDVIEMPVLLDDHQSGAAMSMLLEDAYGREAVNRQDTERRLAGEGVSWSFSETVGEFADAIVDAASLADLIVVNRIRGVADSIIMRTGKPVLAVPESAARFDATGRALIAWDGSASATAALQASIPLLALASDVRLFSVCRVDDDPNLGEAGSYLSRHGIHPEIFQIHDERGAIHRRILDECASWGADWCVMGAYGHGRAREALFGGVTREVLGESNLPLILAH